MPSPDVPDNATHACAGSVLFMALIFSVMMFLIAGTLLVITMTELRLSDFEYRSAQAFYAAESAIVTGIAKLRQDAAYRGEYAPLFYDAGGQPGTIEISTRAAANSQYRFILCGNGRISGWRAAAARTVEQEVTIKPFALFAQEQVTLSGACTIYGHVHGNVSVEIGSSVLIKGNVTASTSPVLNMGKVEDGEVSSEADALEPQITFPQPDFKRYGWLALHTYACLGADGEAATCQAQALVHDTLQLDLDEDPETPAEQIELFSSDADDEHNPAHIYYLTEEIPAGRLSAFNVDGTVLIPPDYPGESVAIHGSLNIQPHETSERKYPALLSAKDLNVTLRGDLAEASESIEENQIEGFIYTLGDLTMIADTSGRILQGSVFARRITLIGNPILRIEYDSKILSAPSPGFDLIETGLWQESCFN